MNQKYKMLVNEGFIFFAFGFALNGYHITAVIFAMIAVILSVQSHSIHVFQRHGIHIMELFTIEIVMIHLSHLDEIVPSIAAVSFASLISADLWMESSEKAIGQVMKGMTAVMIVFLIMSLVMKNLFYGTGNTCLIIGLVFMPSSLEYLHREYRYHRQTKAHQNSRKSCPAVE